MVALARRAVNPLPQFHTRRNLILDSPLSSVEHRALQNFDRFANNDTGWSWPCQETLAKKMRCSLRTVRRTVARLKRLGVLIVSRPATRGVNRYKIDWAALAEMNAEERPQVASRTSYSSHKSKETKQPENARRVPNVAKCEPAPRLQPKPQPAIQPARGPESRVVLRQRESRRPKPQTKRRPAARPARAAKSRSAFRELETADLRATDRAQRLYAWQQRQQRKRRPVVDGGHGTLQRLLTVAAYAVEYGRDPAKLFAWLVSRGEWGRPGQRHEDAATAERKSWTRAEADRQRGIEPPRDSQASGVQRITAEAWRVYAESAKLRSGAARKPPVGPTAEPTAEAIAGQENSTHGAQARHVLGVREKSKSGSVSVVDALATLRSSFTLGKAHR